MIDRTLINPERLLDRMLDDCAGNINRWWRLVEFVPGYMPPYPRPDTKPQRCAIRCRGSFLRDLGRGVFVWDIYGSDFLSPEQALLGLMKAPVPPFLLKAEVWADPGCNCWLGTDATYGDSRVREKCPVHGDAATVVDMFLR